MNTPAPSPDGRAGARRRTWPRGAVFDCDGLLVDSASCWEQAYEQVARSVGHSLAHVDLAALAGASVGGAAAALGVQLGRPVDPAVLRSALGDAFAAARLVALPGAGALVRALAEEIPLAVASNAPAAIVAQVLERLELAGAFAAVVSAEQTAAHKPAPDVYLEACRCLRVEPADAIALEDSALGARAAREAGLFVIAVPSSGRARVDGDLTVPRLDDPRLLGLLGVPAEGRHEGRPPSRAERRGC